VIYQSLNEEVADCALEGVRCVIEWNSEAKKNLSTHSFVLRIPSLLRSDISSFYFAFSFSFFFLLFLFLVMMMMK
jgi:hypothetical protein